MHLYPDMWTLSRNETTLFHLTPSLSVNVNVFIALCYYEQYENIALLILD